ncbi:MAG TPA: DUF4411 family protein [Jatrophihabitans sp.]|jgi:hypothetical protein|uniref:DUF4411 family protein n=1 Tax=Jatrophihabitans sp. TaxID=1932789 RepID=UPI002EEFAD46
MHLFDANTFMEAQRTYYPIDLMPGFWEWLKEAHGNGDLASVKAVYDEILGGKKEDELVKWAKSMPPSFWLPDTAESLASVRQIGEWATDPARPYNDAAKAEFMDSADLRLIARAHVLKATVVSRETSAPDAKKRIKIPDVCAAFGVSCSQPFPVYRLLGMKP